MGARKSKPWRSLVKTALYKTSFIEFLLYLSGSQKSKKLNSSLCQTACVIEGMGVAGVTRGPEHIFKSMGFWDLDLGFRVSIGLSKGATLLQNSTLSGMMHFCVEATCSTIHPCQQCSRRWLSQSPPCPGWSASPCSSLLPQHWNHRKFSIHVFYFNKGFFNGFGHLCSRASKESVTVR